MFFRIIALAVIGGFLSGMLICFALATNIHDEIVNVDSKNYFILQQARNCDFGYVNLWAQKVEFIKDTVLVVFKAPIINDLDFQILNERLPLGIKIPKNDWHPVKMVIHEDNAECIDMY